MREKSNKELVELFKPILDKKDIDYSKYDLASILGLVKERATFINDLWGQTFFFFEAPTEYNAKVVKKRWKTDVPELLLELNNAFKTLDSFNSQSIHASVEAFIGTKEIGMGKVMNAIRLAITGDAIGPDLKIIMELLGKEESCQRIDDAIKNISK